MTGLARLFDPDTSQRAAGSISGRVERTILDVFQTQYPFGFTDDELCNGLRDLHPPTVKSARSRLTNAGLLIDTGKRRPSNRGRDMIVWAAMR